MRVGWLRIRRKAWCGAARLAEADYLVLACGEKWDGDPKSKNSPRKVGAPDNNPPNNPPVYVPPSPGDNF